MLDVKKEHIRVDGWGFAVAPKDVLHPFAGVLAARDVTQLVLNSSLGRGLLPHFVTCWVWTIFSRQRKRCHCKEHAQSCLVAFRRSCLVASRRSLASSFCFMAPANGSLACFGPPKKRFPLGAAFQVCVCTLSLALAFPPNGLLQWLSPVGASSNYARAFSCLLALG